MIPGRALHRLASRAFSVKTMQLVVEPAIADLQKEHDRAAGASSRMWVLLAGYISILKVIGLCALTALLATDERQQMARSAGLLSLMALTATLLLVVAVRFLPVHFDWAVYRSHPGYLIARSVPLGIALAVPYVIAAVCRRGPLPPRAMAVVVGLVVAVSITSFVTSQWVVPKVTATASPDDAAVYGIFGVFTGIGNERYDALSRENRRPMTISSRFVSYTSESIACAPLVLAAFVLAVYRRRKPTRLAALSAPTAALAVYLLVMTFSDNTNLYPSSWWIWDPRRVDPMFYLVWIPNAVLALLTVAMFYQSSNRLTDTDASSSPSISTITSIG